MTRTPLPENPRKTTDEVFMKNGVEIVRNPGALNKAELIHTLQGVDHLGLRSKMSVTREMLEANPQLKATGTFCIGANQIDLEAAAELSIYAFDAPCPNTRSVVGLAIGEIIDLRRRVTMKSLHFHRGIRGKSADGAYEARGRTLGVIGYDSIGTQLSVLAETVSLNVISYDVAECFALGNATRMSTVESVLREADVASVHVDDQLVNANPFGAHEFAMMKPEVLFISLSCGFIVDIDAPHDVPVLDHLASAAANVFPEEPSKNDDPFTSPLARLDNMILTPHIGGSMEEAQYGIGRFVTGRIADYENTGSTDMSVNLPNLQPSAPEESCYRITPIHHDILGVLTTVNNTSAQTGTNIGAQIFGTAG